MPLPVLSAALIAALLCMLPVHGSAQPQNAPEATPSEGGALFVPLPANRREAFHPQSLRFSTVRSGNRVRLVIWGGVGSGDAERVRAALNAAKPLEEILLYSPGGSLEEGLEIGRILRRNRATTRIPRNFDCVSSCNFMFLGGVVRYIEPGGRFGVHMFSTPSIPSTVAEAVSKAPQIADDLRKKYPSREITVEHVMTDILDAEIKEIQEHSAQIAAQIARFLTEMQLSLRFLTAFATIPNETVKYLTRDELRDFNIVNSD